MATNCPTWWDLFWTCIAGLHYYNHKYITSQSQTCVAIVRMSGVLPVGVQWVACGVLIEQHMLESNVGWLCQLVAGFQHMISERRSTLSFPGQLSCDMASFKMTGKVKAGGKVENNWHLLTGCRNHPEPLWVCLKIGCPKFDGLLWFIDNFHFGMRKKQFAVKPIL